MSSALSLRDLSKRYGSAIAVDAVTLDVEPGELLVLLGPSGCGKTTTLRMVAGFTEASGGDIRVDDRSIVALPAHRREMGIVFQSYALFPHMSVAGNVGFGLEMRGVGKPEREARISEMLKLVKLDHLAGRLPRELSGGQQQRVAIARALAIRPRMLLLDEPLSNLDAALRLEVAREMRLLQKASDLTTIMVTHDQDEAMAMADRLVVMRDGRVEQIGDQQALYEQPQSPFVARFIGHSNLVSGELRDGNTLDIAGATVSLAARYEAGGPAVLAVRPERIGLAPPGADPDERAVGRVELFTYLGAVVEHSVHLGDNVRVVVTGPSSGPGAVRRFRPGDGVALCWGTESERLFGEGESPLPARPRTVFEARSTERISHA